MERARNNERKQEVWVERSRDGKQEKQTERGKEMEKLWELVLGQYTLIQPSYLRTLFNTLSGLISLSFSCAMFMFHSNFLRGGFSFALHSGLESPKILSSWRCTFSFLLS